MKSVILFAAVIFIFSVLLEAQTVAPSTSQMRRSYVGGKDDSDLTVQTLRKITRKGEEVEPEYQGYGESGDSGDSTEKPAEKPRSTSR